MRTFKALESGDMAAWHDHQGADTVKALPVDVEMLTVLAMQPLADLLRRVKALEAQRGGASGKAEQTPDSALHEDLREAFGLPRSGG